MGLPMDVLRTPVTHLQVLPSLPGGGEQLGEGQAEGESQYYVL